MKKQLGTKKNEKRLGKDEKEETMRRKDQRIIFCASNTAQDSLLWKACIACVDDPC
jgi:hypothetical protein